MKKIIMIAIVIMLFAPLVVAQEENNWNPHGVTWDHNTEPDLAGYYLKETTISGQYTTGISVPAGTNIYMFPTEEPKHMEGSFYMVVTAYDKAGNESGPSNEIQINFDYVPPKPPVGCSVIK